MIKIEQLLDEMEQYIDSCKTQTFNSRKVIIEREAFDDFIADLRLSLPDVIQRSEKIMSKKEAILNEAQAKAEEMLSDATARTNNMIDESEFVQRATEQANMILSQAQEQAQALIDHTYNECEAFKQNTMQYAVSAMTNLREMMEQNMTATKDLFEQHLIAVNEQYQNVAANHDALLASMTQSQQPEATKEMEAPEETSENVEETTEE